jgi:murein peptide amidase A
VHSFDDLQASWKALRGTGDVTVREVALEGVSRTLLCAEVGSYSAPCIALCAGVHGDERAAPWALLALVQNHELPSSYSYRIWPCTNPSGYSAGTRVSAQGVDINRSFGRGGQTPEARAIVTANRDRKFVLSLDLHEDCDADGFYCYAYGPDGVGRPVITAVREAGFTIQDLARCDLGAPFKDAELDDGVVRPTGTSEGTAIGGLSYSMAIARHAARHALTFESPMRLAFEERVAIHRIAVKAAITALSNL